MSSLLQRVLSGRSRKGAGHAGVAFGADSFALALVRRDGSGRATLEHCAIYPAADLGATLRTTLDRLGASRMATCAVLTNEDYQIVQVEAPDVLPAEMRAAIRWRLRDVISFDVEEAAVDTFEVPEPVRGTQAKMLFAVAAHSAAIERVAGALTAASPGFNAIDIPELCLRNISALLPQDAKGVAMLAVNERYAHLVITRQGVMYLTRRIDTTRRFEPHRPNAGAEPDASALALELQRSLDYYETHYDQTPIGDLVIAPVDERARRLAEALKGETSVRVAVLDARGLLNAADHTGEPAADWLSLLALGAALRVDAAQD